VFDVGRLRRADKLRDAVRAGVEKDLLDAVERRRQGLGLAQVGR